MSLATIWMEGFEQYTTAATAGGPTLHRFDTLTVSAIGTNYGRFGSVGLACSGNPCGVKTLPTSTSVVGMAMAVNPIAIGAGAILFQIYDSAGTVQGTLTRGSDGSISVWRGNSATLLKTSAASVLPLSQYLNIEAQCKIDPAVGTWDVWVGAICVISETGLNTRGSAVVGSNAAKCAFGSASGVGATVYVDDLHAYDASARTGASGAGTPASSTFEHFGDKRVQTLFPNGAGTGDVNPGNWTQVGGTGGSPWTAVNERPQNGDTSYLANPTVGDIKSFALDDLAVGTTGVSAITMTGCFEKDDATARAIDFGVRTSATNAFGPDISCPSTYAYGGEVTRLTDGAGAALAPAGVNGSELLVKIAA